MELIHRLCYQLFEDYNEPLVFFSSVAIVFFYLVIKKK
jgi:hypothetical protein